MELKLLMSMVVVVGCALIGRAYAGGGARRAQTLSLVMDALQLLRIRMLDRLMPVRQALEGSSCAVFRSVGAGMDGVGAAESWRRVRSEQTKHGTALDSLSEADLCALDALFEGLGISGRTEQEALISNALKSLGRLESEARKSGLDKNRLYTTLGLLAGMALALALI